MKASNGFRAAEQQNAIGAEAVVKQRQQFTLQHGIKIDQQVAANNKIQACEWWIEYDIMLRKQHHVPDTLVDLVIHIVAGEETCQSVRRDSIHDRQGKLAPTCCCYCIRA